MGIKCPECKSSNPDTATFCADCGTKLASPQDVSATKTMEISEGGFTRGTLFAGRYEIIEELGKGGMGRVCRAYDKQLEEEVAIKVIKPEIAADKKILDRFKNEIRLARKIIHKNVCRMHDLHEDGTTKFITMEYVAGEDMKSLLRRARMLTVGTAVSIARQVADGLREAHSLGIVHRDLKPSNIMIDKEGDSKIMDFGIARSLIGEGVTAEGVIIGTPEYMSPEQVEGKEVDQRSDIYALGVVLFEMVTGQKPFEGDTPLSIAHKHKYELPPAPKKLVPQIPDRLNRLILRCMEKDRDKRYQTADDFLAELAYIQEALPSAERVTPKRKTFTPHEITVRFRPQKLIIPISIILILAIGAFLFRRYFIDEKVDAYISAKPSLAVLYFENNSGDPGLDNWKDGLPSLLTVDLSQSRFLRVLDDATVYGILKELDLLGSEKYTAEDLRKIAEEGGASHLLMGNYLTSGERFIVSLSLFNARTGDISKYLKEEAENKDEIYDSVDMITKKIKAALDIPDQLIDEDIDRMIADVYTRNSRALQYYIEGERLHHELNFPQAIESLQKAVELDPEFAIAYRIMGNVYGNYLDLAKSYEFLDKAYQFKDRLPKREQLLLEAGLLFQKEETYDKAVNVYKQILEQYPDDFQARFELTPVYSSMGEIDLAIKEGEFLINNLAQKKSRLVYYLLAYNLCLKGDYTKARKYYEMAISEIQPTSTDYFILSYLYCYEKNFDAAFQTIEKRIALFPESLNSIKWGLADTLPNLGYYHLFRDELAKSLQVFENFSKIEQGLDAVTALTQVGLTQGKMKQVLSDWEAAEFLLDGADNLTGMHFHISWGISLLQLGYPQKALEKFGIAQDCIDKEESRIQKKGIERLSGKRRESLLLQACAQLDLGNIEEAESVFQDYKRLVVDPIKKRWQPELDFLEGKIALSKKEILEAMNKLEKSNREKYREDFQTFPCYHAYMMDSLADAYIKAGQIEKAAETYRQIQELLSGRENWGVIYTKSFYKMGKIYEQLGKNTEAREKYSKFLDLWKDADPGIAEVEDAKGRLAALQ